MALWKFGHFKLIGKISQKQFWARGLKLGQLIGDDEYVTWFNFKKKNHLIFPELWPFENLGILNLSARYLEKYLS